MPRRFFRKFAFKRDRLHGQWFLSPFRHLLHDHRLWSIRRRTVVPAFSLGLFIGFMPVPLHIIIAALSALALRVNIPVAAVSTLVSNPLTIGPQFYLCYKVGLLLLGLKPQPFQFELTAHWFGNQFLVIWQPLLLGCLLLGSLASLLGFIALDMLWRASIADYLQRRRAAKRERERESAD